MQIRFSANGLFMQRSPANVNTIKPLAFLGRLQLFSVSESLQKCNLPPVYHSGELFQVANIFSKDRSIDLDSLSSQDNISV